MNMTEIVMIGAGPVGLWTALQIKKRQPDSIICISERYEKYQRSHVLRLDHWSLLLYGRNSNNVRERQFFNDVTGKSLTTVITEPTNSLYIRTNDLEAALKSYAIDEGIHIINNLVTSTDEIMMAHPHCQYFIASDGAHSRMREQLLGQNCVEDHPLQYVVEMKYQVKGKAKKLNALKTNQLLTNMAFEYIGKEKNGVSPVTLRFFLSKKDYEALPQASFKEPLSIDNPDLPASLQKDIKNYLSIRANETGEQYCADSGKLTKLILSLYSAKKFAIKKNEQAWFLVGDCAMGVPYFRALNSGLILGSRLAQIITSHHWPMNDNADKKIKLYNVHRVLHIATEFGIAKGKDMILDSYDVIRKNFGANIDIIDRIQEETAFSCTEEK